MLKLVRVALFWAGGRRSNLCSFTRMDRSCFTPRWAGDRRWCCCIRRRWITGSGCRWRRFFRRKVPGDCAGSARARAVGAGRGSHHGRKAGCRCGAAAGSSGDREGAVRGLLDRRIHAVRDLADDAVAGGRVRLLRTRRRRRTTEAGRAKRDETIAKVRERGTAEFIEANLETLIGSAARRRSPEKVAEAREMMQAVPVDIDCGGAAGAGGAA